MPALSEVMPAIERSGLFITDIEILRLHYAETLKAWRARFHARWNEAAKLFDQRFCRMWDFYLAAPRRAFRSGGMMVVQIQLTKNLRALPLTRDYMFNAEERLRASRSSANAAKPAGDQPERTIYRRSLKRRTFPSAIKGEGRRSAQRLTGFRGARRGGRSPAISASASAGSTSGVCFDRCHDISAVAP